MIWIMLFSHSGTECYELQDSLGIKADYIFTNQTKTSKINIHLLDNYAVESHEDIMDEIQSISKNTNKKIIVTLHGYMRIIPVEIIDLPNVEIFNVHPGDIELYPELKGKDPQRKALDLNLPSTGVVIHRVDEGIDTGEIVERSTIDIDPFWNIVDLVSILRIISIRSWSDFLRNKFNGNNRS